MVDTFPIRARPELAWTMTTRELSSSTMGTAGGEGTALTGETGYR